MVRVKKICYTVAIVLSALIGICPVALVEAASFFPEMLINSSKVEAGLCVHIGATDGRLEIKLAVNGKRLVHGLALDDGAVAKARKAIEAKGLYPLASIEKAKTLTHLPYADNLVNLLIADLDVLGEKAPSRQEILRVICPNGIAYLKKQAKWTRIVKPRPKEMDDWTHFDYGPQGNAVSHDQLVRPPTLVQWISGVQPIKLGGNPAGFVGSMGMRIADGRAFSNWVTQGKDRKFCFGAWDAFNGIPLWHTETKYHGGVRPTHIVAVGDRVYMFCENNGPLVALDAAAGEVVMTYGKAGHLPNNSALASFRVCDDRLVISNKDTLYVLDRQSGKVKWKYKDKQGSLLLFPTVAAEANKVFVVASAIGEDYRVEKRWPNAPARAVLCLDYSTGNVVWRNTEVAGKHIGQVVYSDGKLGLFAAGGIGAGKNPFVGNIRVSDGKLLWTGTFPVAWNRAGYVMLWRDNVMYYADPWKIYTLDPQTGKETTVYGGSYNGRCTRFCATDNWLIYSLVTYVDKDFNGTIQSIARSACANSAFPANGMLYFTPTACGCLTMLRGHIALTPEPLRPPIRDSLRLETGATHKSGASAPPVKRFSMLNSPIAQDWTHQDRTPQLETEPVTFQGKTFAAVIHEHRMQCRDPHKLLWSFTAGGRISSPPVIHKGLCLFGSHDGWIYAVRISDGSLAWRFMAAPYERKMMAFSQLESSWPVYGVVIHQGHICATAGLHPEVGGGIYVYGLQPMTGKLAWKGVLRKSPAVIHGTDRIASRIVPISAFNDVLQSDGDLLSLPSGRSRRFYFDPHKTDAQLKQQLETNPPKRKK